MRKRTVFRLAAGTVAAGGATLAYASLVERNLFTLRRFDVPVLAPDAEPLRILHLSDLHMTPDQRRKQRWVAALAGTDPDLVVVTGDNMAHPDAVPGVLRALAAAARRARRLRLRLQRLPRPGLEEPAAATCCPSASTSRASTCPTEDLRDGAGRRRLGRPEQRPYDDQGRRPHRSSWSAWTTRTSNATTTRRWPGRPRQQADLRIGADPLARAAASWTRWPPTASHLLLAGHTHGGQVCVPFFGALTTNCDLPPSMAKGLHRWPGSDAWLHVSAGLGTHPTAPVRFACRPEASLLTLIPR